MESDASIDSDAALLPTFEASTADSDLCPPQSDSSVPEPQPLSLSPSPNWTSSDSYYATGLGLGDFNGDGRLDLVTANGNDMNQEPLALYYASAHGSFAKTPSWQSARRAYYGHLAVGDINQDGLDDVAVSVFLGPQGFEAPGAIEVYLQGPTGLPPSPSWTSADSSYSFSVALADIDLDADLDLISSCGESYQNHPCPIRWYRNEGGSLQPEPAWTSSIAEVSVDVDVADINDDGWLDLIVANQGSGHAAYLNTQGSFEPTPSWRAQGPSTDFEGNSLDIGDINQDGHPDLLVSDNNQMGGLGRVRLYLGNGQSFSPEAAWTSGDAPDMQSAVALRDLNHDGRLDVLAGAWWAPVRLYLNSPNLPESTPSWISSTSSVIEAFAFWDIDESHLQRRCITLPTIPQRRLYNISDKDARILSVTQNGDPVPYAYHQGFLTLAQSPQGPLVITLLTSSYPHLLVTNWDPAEGNYGFDWLSSP